ncbi:hypothetical protein lerEdw1_017209 [Lerista edwardsae]|nr:hypothetical protein lerEdw1_017209 [Lerista edwardsae]
MTKSLLCLLVLILRNHLQDTAGQAPPQGFKYASYEVIVPKKLTPRYGQEPQDVNYWLKIEGKGHLVHLKQKTGIIPKQFPVFTYSKEGKLQVDYPFIRDDCYYHGFVEDKPSSLAALSTCTGGLRGILRLDNKTYEIQPIQPSATFQHVVYRLEAKEDAVTMRCGLTEEERRRQEAMIHSRKNTAARINSREGWWPHIRYVKNAFVVEHGLYTQFRRNETLIAMVFMEIIHISSSLYEPLRIDLSLVGLEIWSERNHVDTRGTIYEILSKFNTWRRDRLVKRLANDVGHFFVYKSFGPIVGLAYVGQICSTHWASAVESFRTSSLATISNTFTHELGHILGMLHDEKNCTCGRAACIMGPYQADTVLILRNHLQDTAGQAPPQGFKYASYEVIMPKKLTPRYGQEPQNVNYWLQIEGKGHVVHLKQKTGIIPKQFPIFTYSKEGKLQVDYPFIRDDCYYHGFVEDKPSSLAALSTCSGGLRGILRLDNKTYEIQPIPKSATFQHVVYRLEAKEDAVTMRCGLTEEERRRQEAMIHSRKNTAAKINSRGGWWPHIRYAKIAIVVEKERCHLRFRKLLRQLFHSSSWNYLPEGNKYL